MSASSGHQAPGSHQNLTYVFDYSRGLDGVDVPRDVLITRIICGSLAFVAVAIFCGRFVQMSNAYLRHITCLAASRSRQLFWSMESSRLWSRIKKHLIYAPLGRKRHNREIQLSVATNIGTVPSRFHTILIGLYISSQIAYCSLLDYAVNEKPALIAELRGRSGTLAVLNMVPLLILAGRNNPLISLLHVSFDTYNLFHRWLGRIVVLEAITHTVAWSINAADEQNLADALDRIRTTPFFFWGAVAAGSMVFMISHSPSPIRHAFYEAFLHLHQLAALFVILGVYMHLNLDSLPQFAWAKVIVAVWVLERSARFLRLVYLNLSIRDGKTRVIVQALSGEACRVTFFLPRRVHIAPGSHVYAYFPNISLWMSHPFSIAWAEPSSCVTPPAHPSSWLNRGFSPGRSPATSPSRLEKQDFNSKGMGMDLDRAYDGGIQPTTVSLIITARTGMTRQLYDKAFSSPSQTLYMSGFIEGPYTSGPSSIGSYGTAILFSGGAGITHHLLHVRDLLLRAADGCVATQRIYLIWSVRKVECLSWVRSYMDQILQLPNRRQILTVKLFISKPKSSHEIVSPSETVQMFPGRCHPDVVLDEALPKRVGATIVSVCGPGAFADEVRAATRRNIGRGMSIDFVEESFTW
jgi:hypothetical protein